MFNMKQATGSRPAANAPGTRVARMVRTLRQAYLQSFWIPNHERFAEHMTLHHRGEPLLSRRAFCAQVIDRKYARNEQRCC